MMLWMNSNGKRMQKMAVRFEAKEKGEALGLPPSYCSGASYFLGGAMTSLAALATRNLTTVLALILMAAPV